MRKWLRSKRSIFIIIFLFFYIFRLHSVYNFYKPITQVEYYSMNDAVQEKEMVFKVKEAKEVELDELYRKYGKPDEYIDLYEKYSYRFFIVRLQISNNGKEEEIYMLDNIMLSSTTWYSQPAFAFLKQINGENTSTKFHVKPNETRDIILTFSIRDTKGYERYNKDKWYLTFCKDAVKRMILVKSEEI